jgi:hypothetical protein
MGTGNNRKKENIKMGFRKEKEKKKKTFFFW